VVYLEEGLLKRASQRRQRFKAKYAGLRQEYARRWQLMPDGRVSDMVRQKSPAHSQYP